LATTIDITETFQACRDPKDDKFLEIATNGLATYLITGDPDLLVLHPFHGISIISPDTFILTLTQATFGETADEAS
jgi:predicted nucleic acid-binding protein